MTVKHGDLDDCVICMEPPTLPRRLHCGHIFCDTCIVRHFKVKPVCPTCGSIQGVVIGDQLNMSKLTTDCGKYFVLNCLLLNIQRQIFRAYSG
jgi:hypothetical protein